MPNNYKTAQDFDMIEQGVKDGCSSDKSKNYLSCLSKFQMGGCGRPMKAFRHF